MKLLDKLTNYFFGQEKNADWKLVASSIRLEPGID